MRQIVVISGKGGTGKTILTASLAALAKNKVMVDCDVDAADLHLLLKPAPRERHEFRSGQRARIDRAACCECGVCRDACRFDAISEDYTVDSLSCEGCGLCSRICPAEAIEMEKGKAAGEWFVSETDWGPMVHARLGIAEDNSGKLVSEIRQAARELAKRDGLDTVIIDGPPGIGCPVMASLTDTDYAVVVTEPTLSGIHDAERVLDLIRHFRISSGLVINKWDLNPQRSGEIETLCEEQRVELLGKIPFSRRVVESLSLMKPYVEIGKDDVAETIRDIWKTIESKTAAKPGVHPKPLRKEPDSGTIP